MRCTYGDESTLKIMVESFLEYLRNHIDEIDVLDLTLLHVSPNQISDVLEELGYKYQDMEINGWEGDTWMYFSHQNTNQRLCLSYSAFGFDISITLYN